MKLSSETKKMMEVFLLTTNLKDFTLEVLDYDDPIGIGFKIHNGARGYYSSTDVPHESPEQVFFDLVSWASEKESNRKCLYS